MHQNNRIQRPLATLAQLLSCLLLIVFACSLHAQVAGTGSIQGSVTDATGAILPGASVTITNEQTHVTYTAATSSSGDYSAPNLPVGTYSVTVKASGFSTFIQKGNVLEVGSSIDIDAKMAVGAADTHVEVTATSLALQTEDVSFKQTIDESTVSEMPLNGRHMADLVTASGGAAPAPAGDFTGSKYSYQTISVSIAGGGGNTTQWRLDGGDNNDYMGNGNLPFPFPDAVSQFSVESSALGAGSGMHSGGLVNVVTRSGLNQYHGGGFEFVRNNYLDGQNFFATCTIVAPATTCTAKDTLHQNQYGGTIGGPVIIPHLYNGKDKLFFFFGYQWQKTDSSTAATTSHVPTAANLAGDFSITDTPPDSTHLAGSKNTTPGACNTTYVQLYDPLTGAIVPGNKYPTTPTWNAAALKLQKYLPAIAANNDPNNCGVVSYAIPSEIFDKQLITRGDYTINPKNHLYARYLLDGYQAPSFFSPTNILLATPAPGNYERVHTATVGEDWTINSNTVNSAHVTLTRRIDVRSSAPGINACTLGINQYCAVATGFQSTVTNKFNTYCGTCAPGHYNDNSLAFSDDVTMIRGKHQIVFGGEYIRNQLNIVGAYQSNGVFNFSGIYSGSAAATGTVGDADLDLLEGAMSTYSQSKQQQNALRAPIPSLYVQDTFHATRHFTAVAGIRWAPEYLPVDYFNRGSIFDYASFIANKVSSVYPTAPAGSFFYGDPGVTRQFSQNSPWQFSPNLGFTLDPEGNGKTVIRGGVEMVYDEVNFFSSQRVNQNPPFATASSPASSAQLCLSTPWLIGGTGIGCNQVGGTNTEPFPQPVVPNKSQAVFPAQGQFIVLPAHFHPPYTIQYTASIQHDLGKGWQLQFDYIGNGTRHAPIGYPYNNAVFIPGVWGAGGTGCAGIVTTGPAAVKPGAAGTSCSTTGNQNSRFALTIANPLQGNQYTGGGGGSVVVGDYATANYNGLVTTLQHRLSSTLSVLANWTWSKCLNEADSGGDITGSSVSQPNNPRADYAPCGADFRHIENVVIIATSKFGFSNRLERTLLDNWEFAPKVQILSGQPFTVTAGVDNSLTDNNNLDRPNLVPGVSPYARVAFQKVNTPATRTYLNLAAFQQVTAPCTAALPSGTVLTAGNCPTIGTLGNAPRNAFRGIPAYNVDAQVSRIFPIYERINLDVRIEAFNVLNHPNFNAPTGGTTGTLAGPTGGTAVLTSSTFGQITSTSNQARVFQGSVKLTF